MDEQMGHPFDLLLDRKTYELFADYWPNHKDEGPGINNATKSYATFLGLLCQGSLSNHQRRCYRPR